jgi:hypothetical protein
MAGNSKAVSAAKQAVARSTAARIPPAAPCGARWNIGECTNAHVLDRIDSSITTTTFREVNSFCSPTAARGRPFAVHVHERARTQIAALTRTLLAGSAA